MPSQPMGRPQLPALRGCGNTVLTLENELTDMFVCIFNTFDDNFEIENDFRKYLKETFW